MKTVMKMSQSIDWVMSKTVDSAMPAVPSAMIIIFPLHFCGFFCTSCCFIFGARAIILCARKPTYTYRRESAGVGLGETEL